MLPTPQPQPRPIYFCIRERAHDRRIQSWQLQLPSYQSYSSGLTNKPAASNAFCEGRPKTLSSYFSSLVNKLHRARAEQSSRRCVHMRAALEGKCEYFLKGLHLEAVLPAWGPRPRRDLASCGIPESEGCDRLRRNQYKVKSAEHF